MNTRIILKNLNLLFVDDNDRISSEIYSIFSPMFKSITLAQDSKTALSLFADNTIDIVITDIEMPGKDGIFLIESIRSMNSDIPIIILSAHSDKHYLMRAANLRIDGYITKPLNFKKLNLALTRAADRLRYKITSLRLSPKIIYQPLQKILYVDDQEISLGSKECLLLELFVNKNNRVVGKPEIAEAVWPDGEMTNSALKNLLSELRRKLKYDIIQNQPARGWILRVHNAEPELA